MACLAVGVASAGAAEKDCRTAFFQHLQASPDGLAIYAQVKQPGFFEGWMRCDDAQLALPTAIHESTHVVSAETDAFPLIGGGTIQQPHEVSTFFPPYRIARSFKPDDLVSTYLRQGRASSSMDFLYLLDELNAYSHDLNAAVDLRDLKHADETVDHRDGVSAMMAFVAVYAEMARAKEPETWTGLRAPRVRRTVLALWGQAERVLSSACGIPHFGHSDRYYIRSFCAFGDQSAIADLLGRAPVCPVACLQSRPEDDAASEIVANTPFVDFGPVHRRRLGRSRTHAKSAMSTPAEIQADN